MAVHRYRHRDWPWFSTHGACKELRTTAKSLCQAIDAGLFKEDVHYRHARRNRQFNIEAIRKVWAVVLQRLQARKQLGAKRFDKLVRDCTNYGAFR